MAKENGDGSVTRWLVQLKEGNAEAARQIWERYFARLTQLARRRLTHVPRQVVDEEDVALSVLDALCRGAENGVFPNLLGRDDLWPLLLSITRNKTADAIRWQSRKKRNPKMQIEGTIIHNGKVSQTIDIEEIISQEPTPEFLVSLAEEHERLIGLLRDDVLRQIANAKLQGIQNEDIAETLGLSVRTIQRKIHVIYDCWSRDLKK